MDNFPVAALYVREDSVYKSLPGVDAWDKTRDARQWPGGAPVVAHPPCSQWGKLKGLAHRNDEQKALALEAVNAVRAYGGCLEHPAGSELWQAAGLPLPGEKDQLGGYTVVLDQLWFGHAATKRTWVYICGTEDLPEMPFHLGYPTRSVSTRQRHPKRLPELTHKAREQTPEAFASWLIEVARRCRRPSNG